MKKIAFILIVGLLLLSVPAIAEMHGNIEIGRKIDNPEAFAKIQLNYDFDIWQLTNIIYGGWQTWMVIKNGYAPYLSIYKIGYQIHYQEFYIDLKHECAHNVLTTVTGQYPSILYLDHAITTLSIGINF